MTLVLGILFSVSCTEKEVVQRTPTRINNLSPPSATATKPKLTSIPMPLAVIVEIGTLEIPVPLSSPLLPSSPPPSPPTPQANIIYGLIPVTCADYCQYVERDSSYLPDEDVCLQWYENVPDAEQIKIRLYLEEEEITTEGSSTLYGIGTRVCRGVKISNLNGLGHYQAILVYKGIGYSAVWDVE